MNSKKNILRVFVYNDLPFCVNSKNEKLIEKLEYALLENRNVVLTNIREQIVEICSKSYQPFDIAIAVGDSGERVANLINEKTNWFPNLTTFNIAREESSKGRYFIPNTYLDPIKVFFIDKKISRIAIIDDTLYSGLTIQAIINCIPIKLQKNIDIFLLQGLSITLEKLDKEYEFNIALKIDGIPEKEVTIIKASGLFMRGAIRISNSISLAFFEREEWMRIWFPKNWKEIIEICKKLLEK